MKSLLEGLGERIENLENLQEVYHGKAPALEDMSLLREVWVKRRAAQEDLPSKVWSLEEDLTALELEVRSQKEKEPQVPGGGRKTEARTLEVRQILKASWGSLTFQELEESLGLSPS
jgi:hypothetical protein